MRGEREAGFTPFMPGSYRGGAHGVGGGGGSSSASVGGGSSATAAPGTPITYTASQRANPITFQRMHSNDSDKYAGSNGPTSIGSGRVSD